MFNPIVKRNEDGSWTISGDARTIERMLILAGFGANMREMYGEETVLRHLLDANRKTFSKEMGRESPVTDALLERLSRSIDGKSH